jgi:hypothetical protein
MRAKVEKKKSGETRVSPKAKLTVVPAAAPTMAEMVTKLTGQLPVMAPLKSVKKNAWNPNRMNPFEKKSLEHGLRKDGWLASHALTIWRTDDKGETKNIIIDGEHRHEAALEIGFDMGPMVFLDGLTEAKAKEWTIKIDAKRGRFDDDALSLVLRDIEPAMDLESRSLDLGISSDRLDILLKVEEPLGRAGDVPSNMPSQTAGLMTIHLTFNSEQHADFSRSVKELAARFKTSNITDTVREVVRRAMAASAQK